jgi:hypothetical protein
VLLTRSRLCPRASPGSSLHLHVLSTPPAFVLSQDQTLREELLMCTSTKSVAMPTAGGPRTRRGLPGIGRGLILAPPLSRSRWRGGRRLSKPGRTRQPDHSGLSVHMLLSFQRPPCLSGGDSSVLTRREQHSRCGRESIALARRRGKLGFLCPGLPLRRASWPSGDDVREHSRSAPGTPSARARRRQPPPPKAPLSPARGGRSGACRAAGRARPTRQAGGPAAPPRAPRRRASPRPA